MLGGGLHHLPPPHAGLHAGDPALGIDVHALHPPRGDHQSPAGVADGAVPGGLDGDPQLVRDRPRDRRDDVGRARGADGDGRRVLHGDVPGRHLGGEAVVAGGVDRTADAAAEVVEVGRRNPRRQGVEDVVPEREGGEVGIVGETHAGPLSGCGGSRRSWVGQAEESPAPRRGYAAAPGPADDAGL